MSMCERVIPKETIKGDIAIARSLLQAKHPLFLDVTITEHADNLVLVMDSKQLYDWHYVTTLDIEEQLRHLINIGTIFERLTVGIYTYRFSPDQLLFDLNASPFLIEKGIVGQVAPYCALSLSMFMRVYQAMIISILDKQSTYDSLISGKLAFYTGNAFCESIRDSSDLASIQNLLQDYYVQEKTKSRLYFTKVTHKKLAMLTISRDISIVLASLFLFAFIYMLWVAVPRYELLAHLRLSFARQDYTELVRMVHQIDKQALTREDKYMLAYAVMMTEPLTQEQKVILNKLPMQATDESLRYWILIGQAKIDEALELAHFIDTPQLIMYALTKKIDVLQHDTQLTTTQKIAELTKYKKQLDELKQHVLTDDTVQDSTTHQQEN